MDARKEPRFNTRNSVRVTILGSSDGIPDQLVPACMVNLSGRGLSLHTETPVPVGSAVRIDVEDNILLGEVCHLSQIGAASFNCGIHLEQALTSVSDLFRLMSGIMGESRRADSVPVTPGAHGIDKGQMAKKDEIAPEPAADPKKHRRPTPSFGRR